MQGILLQRTGQNESLVRFWLRFGQVETKTELGKLVKLLLFANKLKVVRHKEKTAGLRSQMFLRVAILDRLYASLYAFLSPIQFSLASHSMTLRACVCACVCVSACENMPGQLRFTLIRAYFPHLSMDKTENMLLRWVPATKDSVDTSKPNLKPSGFYASYLADVLGKLDGEEDGKDFRSLKDVVDDYKRQEFVLSRVGMSRSRASHWTPRQIKNLKPPSSTLVWQVTANAFQGYYPIPQKVLDEKMAKATSKGKKKIKTMWSRHRGYQTKRNKLQALQEIVKWLWKMHKENGGDS